MRSEMRNRVFTGSKSMKSSLPVRMYSDTCVMLLRKKAWNKVENEPDQECSQEAEANAFNHLLPLFLAA